MLFHYEYNTRFSPSICDIAALVLDQKFSGIVVVVVVTVGSGNDAYCSTRAFYSHCNDSLPDIGGDY
jgi:hypothetical protein